MNPGWLARVFFHSAMIHSAACSSAPAAVPAAAPTVEPSLHERNRIRKKKKIDQQEDPSATSNFWRMNRCSTRPAVLIPPPQENRKLGNLGACIFVLGDDWQWDLVHLVGFRFKNKVWKKILGEKDREILTRAKTTSSFWYSRDKLQAP